MEVFTACKLPLPRARKSLKKIFFTSLFPLSASNVIYYMEVLQSACHCHEISRTDGSRKEIKFSRVRGEIKSEIKVN